MFNGLSIIIPVLNEEEAIRPMVERIFKKLHNRCAYEIIFIDDHSTDNTAKEIKHLLKEYPVSYYKKLGPQGKAQALLQGFSHAKYEILCMIDSDLQYPPEAIPAMLQQINNGFDVVVANRSEVHTSRLRQILSKTFNYIFCKLLHQLNVDVQSGLKVFRKEIIERLTLDPFAWTFDLEFLLAAQSAGYTIGFTEIKFKKRDTGKSKIKLLSAIFQIGFSAILLKLRAQQIIPFHQNAKNKKGKGFHYKRKEFIHFTELNLTESAVETILDHQKLFFFVLILAIALGIYINWINTIILIVALLTVQYFIDLLFNLSLILRTFHHSPEIRVSRQEFKSVTEWPMYTIFCPLYREWAVVSQFVKAIDNLDYPKDKLQVQLLLEEDDKETIEHIRSMNLPEYFEIIVVPDTLPKTKPKACNYGLLKAKGEFAVIFDAEDIPDPDQLKKAVIGFHKSDDRIACIQAKLNYYNKSQNLLTRLFTLEYSLWFDLILTGLQSINAPIPLGGTSNHFKVKRLREVRGWDSFNVTEDCDLGIRLAKKGYRTAIIDSLTLEEANSDFFNWLHQRSRWIKGYMQTYLVHMRNPKELLQKNFRIHFFTFQLIVGGKILSLFINPLMWATTILYFSLRAYFGPIIEQFFPSFIFYIAVMSLVIGNFIYMYMYMIGCAKRNQFDLMKYVYFVPFYWLAMSVAAWMALIQLLIKPHYWPKTVHGLHLKLKKEVYDGPKNTASTYSAMSAIAKRSAGMILMSMFVSFAFFTLSLIFPTHLSQADKSQFILLSLVASAIVLISYLFHFVPAWVNPIRHFQPGFFYLNFSIATFVTAIISVLGIMVFIEFPSAAFFNLTTLKYIIPFLVFSNCLSLGNVIILYHLLRKQLIFFFISIIFQFIMLIQIFISTNIIDLLQGLSVIGLLFAGVTVILHFLQRDGDYLLANIINFLGLLFPISLPDKGPDHKNILIMNWYDMKHKWGGGAEYYIHNFAKSLVSEGHNVTIFCGNDQNSPRNETIDGVQIIRRGGLFSVPIWAFFYYVFRFRRAYDLVIDSAKGVPFFTPLYVKKPIIGLICHIHQEMFRKGLPFPLAQIAMFLEEMALPNVYKNTQMLTISESTKRSMKRIGLGKDKKIAVILPGVNTKKTDAKKTKHPSVLYVGRLRDYKNIDIAIRAIDRLVDRIPDIHLTIAGTGEEELPLKQLVRTLQLENNVSFLGYIDDDQKADLFTEAWVAVHPSEVEGWGITNIEANICGTPVIASDVDGNKDSVKHNETGILVKVRDIDALAEALETVIKDHKLRSRLIENAQVWGNQFTWAESARQGIELFKEFVKEAPEKSTFRALGDRIQYIKEFIRTNPIKFSK